MIAVVLILSSTQLFGAYVSVCTKAKAKDALSKFKDVCKGSWPMTKQFTLERLATAKEDFNKKIALVPLSPGAKDKFIKQMNDTSSNSPINLKGVDFGKNFESDYKNRVVTILTYILGEPGATSRTGKPEDIANEIFDQEGYKSSDFRELHYDAVLGQEIINLCNRGNVATQDINKLCDKIFDN